MISKKTTQHRMAEVGGRGQGRGGEGRGGLKILVISEMPKVSISKRGYAFDMTIML